MYQIGIIDDVAGQRADIQVAVLDNITEGTPVAFKEYELNSRSKEDLFKEIQEDISADRIHALIVDFRLDTTKDVIKGWEIIEFMHEEIPEFPVVILTNVPDEGLESPHTDADKVYAKKEFFEGGFAGMCCHGRENPVEYEEIRIQESESGGGTDGKPYAVGAEWIGYGRNGKGHGD